VALETQLECNPKGEKLSVVDDGEVGEDDKENLFEVEKRLENEDEEEDPPSPPSPPPPPPLPPPRLCFSCVASAAAHTVKHCPIFVFSPHHRMQLIQNQTNQANQANRTRNSPTSSSSSPPPPPPPPLPPPTSSYSYSLNNSSQIMIITPLTPYPFFFSPQIQTRSMTNKLHQIQLVCFPFTKHNTKQNKTRHTPPHPQKTNQPTSTQQQKQQRSL
jgi:hypothetical protein